MPGSRRVHCYRAPAQGADAGGLGAAVQTLAEYRGVSLMALARAAQPTREPGSIPTWIYRIANGTNAQIKTAVLLRLCRALSCDPDALLRLAGLWPAAAIGDRRSALGDDGDVAWEGAASGSEARASNVDPRSPGWEDALLDFRLSEAEDAIAVWPESAREAVLRVLEAMAPLPWKEEETA